MASSSAQKAALPILALRELATAWAEELGMPWRELEDHLFAAAYNGEFEELLFGTGILACVDPRQRLRQVRPISVELLRATVPLGGKVEENYRDIVLADDRFFLAKEAVLAIAAKRGWPPPSWWSTASAPKPSAPKSYDDHLERMMQILSEKKIPEATLLARLKEEFGSGFHRTHFDEAFRCAIPKGMKFGRGRRPKSD
jgi:hypothetical protein